jgi:dTMP kinase
VGALVRQVLARRISGAPGRGFDAEAMALLFAADRLDHFRADVEPHLAAGYDVVSDRYTLSSLAYQSLTTGDARWVEAVNARAPAPDLTIFLRVRPAVAWRRRFAESGSRELYEVPAFQRRVARSYERCLRILRRRGEAVAVVEGEGPVGQVAAAVRAEALRRR